MACGIQFLSENLVNQSVMSISSGTENAQFPLSNIKIESTARKFRSVENTCVIIFDMQQTRTIDYVAIAGDSVQTLGLTAAEIKTSLTTDFSGATAVPLELNAEHALGFTEVTSVDHRYVELTLTGNGSFCELSNIFIGAKIEILRNNLSIGSFRYGYEDRSELRQNDYGMKFINKLNLQKTISGSIEFCDKTEQETIDDLWLAHGISKPLWVIVDRESMGMNDGRHKLGGYVYFSNQSSWSANGGQNYTIDLDFEQVI